MSFSDKKPRLKWGALVAALAAGMVLTGTPLSAYAEENVPVADAPAADAPSGEASSAEPPSGEAPSGEEPEEEFAGVPTDAPADASAMAPLLAPTASGFNVSGHAQTEPGVAGSVLISGLSGEGGSCGNSSMTAANGDYTVTLIDTEFMNCSRTGVYTASYSIHSSATAQAPFGYAQSFWAGQGKPSTPWAEDAVPLNVPATGDLTGIDFTLNPNGQVTGKVSVPIDVTAGEWVNVVAFEPGDSDPFEVVKSIAWVKSDGSFVMELPAGDFQFVLAKMDYAFGENQVIGYHSASGMVTDVSKATTVSVAAKQITPNIDFAPNTPPTPGTITAGNVSISGTTEVGQTLTASATGWQPGNVTFSYQWNRNGSPIGGAAGSTYVLTGADANAVISVSVTGAKPDFTSANKTSASVGPVIDPTPGSISLTVLGENSAPLSGAWTVVTSVSSGVIYGSGKTDANGALSFENLPRGEYHVQAWGNGSGSDSENVVIDAPGQNRAVTLTVLEPSLPEDVAIDGANPGWNGMSISPWSDHEITVTGNPNAVHSSFTVNPGNLSFPLVETPANSGKYVGTIPAQVTTPNADGKITIAVALEWADDSTYTESFELVYIDPSGHVVDRYGTPAGGSTVTLFRSDTADGAFTQVADGDTNVMDPSINDVNPFVTDNVGFFRWDVAPGWYQVRANHAGASVTTAAMPVPPEQLGLVLAVPAGEKPVATTAPKVNGDVKVGSKITASPGVWPVVAGELAPIEVHSYQWLRDGQPISGATQSQYTPVAADQGKTLTVALVLGRTLAADAGTVETWTVTLDAGKVPGSQLANTGADATLAQVGIAGAALLLLGGVLVVIAKRRREAAVSAD